MRFVRARTSFIRPSDATAYTAGDLIGNSLTPASVVPMSFQMPSASGKIAGARMTIQPASGNLVIVAADIDLLLFRPFTSGINSSGDAVTPSIPFAAAGFPADNAALTLTDTMYKELVATWSFLNGAWRNQLGGLVAGTVGWQAVATNAFNSLGAIFNLELCKISGVYTLYGLLQAKAAWTPGAVAQTITVDLDVEPEVDA